MTKYVIVVHNCNVELLNVTQQISHAFIYSPKEADRAKKEKKRKI